MNDNTSIIHLCHNIRLDKTYKNVINYTETEMLNLCTDNNNLIGSRTNYSFIRPSRNKIKVDFTYSECLRANYIAFQNKDYSNKWFFAFIDSVEYLNDKTTIINFTIDNFSTWFNDVVVKRCFVVREHVNNDTIGAHTIPEGLEHGEYICAGVTSLYSGGNTTYIAISATDQPDEIGMQISKTYNGIYSGTMTLLFDSSTGATNYLRAMDLLNKGDAVVSVYLVPTAIVSSPNFETISIDVSQTPSGQHITTRLAKLQSSDSAVILGTSANITSPTTIDGYTPKNKKLFNPEYNYFYVSNNAGADVPFNYIDFVDNTASFKVIGALTPGCSIRCVPLNYKKLADNNTLNSFNSGLSGAKYPICSWRTNVYNNWLAENALNISWTSLGGALGFAGGLAMAVTGVGTTVGLGLMGTGIGMIVNNMKESYQHSLIPQQAKGNTNTGDVVYASSKMDFPCYKMTIRAEYARVIDDFFSAFGYMVNRVKDPNIIGRHYWNYVQIGSSEKIGYGNVPHDAMDEINRIFQTGVTIWHDHAHIGDYNLTNNIVS